MHRAQFNHQQQNCDTFYRPTVVNAQKITGSGKNSDAGIVFKYVADKYSRAFEDIVSCSRQFAKDFVLQPKTTRKFLWLLLISQKEIHLLKFLFDFGIRQQQNLFLLK